MKFIAKVVSLSILIAVFLKADGFSQCQQVLFSFSGETIVEGAYGQRLSSAGDVNNDGFNDVLISALAYGTLQDSGRVYVFSGQTGETLDVFSGETEGESFGWSIAAAGDVNNDGFDDVLVGAIYHDGVGVDAGRAYVYSGQTGEPLYVFNGQAYQDHFGSAVSTAGDVNNDGYADMVISAPLHDGVGRVYVYSGATGGVLYILDGVGLGDHFGGSVSSAGDINQDGYSDIIIGSWGFDTELPFVGRALVISGQDG
ncbi:MAG: integrin alpha, partial [Candidatus Zixiibacteriota bacterium]